jgi:hypothetical protein
LTPLVLAHGVGARADLPLPAWLFAYGAGFAVLISFVALGILWPRPRLAAAADGAALPPAVQTVRRPGAWLLRAIGLLVYGVVLVACLWGTNDAGINISPYVIYVSFWVGMQLVSTFVGDAWRALNPLDTLALVAFGRWLPERTARPDPGLWPAAVMIGSFAWMELAYHDPASPRALGVWLVAYSAAALAGAAVWGRAWLREGEGFAALFHLLAALAPLHRDPETSRLRARWPLTGLSQVRPRRGLDALILTVLGSTTFDGVTRLDWWNRDVVGTRAGWERTMVTTVGLLFVIAAVAVVWVAATRLSARITGDDPDEVADAYLPSLVPIVIAYAIAHYFSLFVYESYNVVALASDPFGRGWDVFGTIDVVPNYRLLSTTTIAWVQAAAIVVGHVSGVVAAHDRAVERHASAKLATRSQWPLVAAMVLYTVGGLGLLLGA